MNPASELSVIRDQRIKKKQHAMNSRRLRESHTQAVRKVVMYDAKSWACLVSRLIMRGNPTCEQSIPSICRLFMLQIVPIGRGQQLLRKLHFCSCTRTPRLGRAFGNRACPPYAAGLAGRHQQDLDSITHGIGLIEEQYRVSLRALVACHHIELTSPTLWHLRHHQCPTPAPRVCQTNSDLSMLGRTSNATSTSCTCGKVSRSKWQSFIFLGSGSLLLRNCSDTSHEGLADAF